MTSLMDMATTSVWQGMPRPLVRTMQIGMGWFGEEFGGIERYYHDLLHHLPDVRVSYKGIVSGSPAVARQSNGSVVSFGTSRSPLWLRWRQVHRCILNLLRRNRFDLAVSHHANHTFPALRALRSVPMVVHFHGPWALERMRHRAGDEWLHTRIEKAVYRRANLCITLSEAFAQILEKIYGVKRSRIRVIPGGVESDRFDSPLSLMECRERLSWPTDRPVVVSVRRLTRRMGIENLIDATQLVRKRIPDIQVIIAGRGPLAHEMQERVDELGLNRHVKLIGQVDDDVLPMLYRAADLTVVPTVALEGFGMSTVESLAAGTPTLVTPVGGSPEVVERLSSNMVMTGTEPGVIADSIEQALLGRMRLPTADTCRRYARHRFDWSAVVREIRLVYGEAL